MRGASCRRISCRIRGCCCKVRRSQATPATSTALIEVAPHCGGPSFFKSQEIGSIAQRADSFLQNFTAHLCSGCQHCARLQTPRMPLPSMKTAVIKTKDDARLRLCSPRGWFFAKRLCVPIRTKSYVTQKSEELSTFQAKGNDRFDQALHVAPETSKTFPASFRHLIKRFH